MQPLILDLNFSFLTTIMVDHYPLFEFPFPQVSATILLEYFADEKPLRMSQISRKFDPLVLARIVCIY